MLRTLHHDEAILCRVLGSHIPGRAAAPAAAADAQSASLPDGMEPDAVMGAEFASAGGDDIPTLQRQVTPQEGPEVLLADEADAGAVRLVTGYQADLHGHAPHRGFLQFTQREAYPCQLLLIQPVQKIALVLVGVQGSQQLQCARMTAHPGVVTGGNAVGTQCHGMVQKGAKLDVLIAQHIRIGGEALTQGLQTGREHLFLIGLGQVGGVYGDAQGGRHTVGILCIQAGLLTATPIRFLPVLHVDGLHAQALLLQQPCRHGGIHPAGQADHRGG